MNQTGLLRRCAALALSAALLAGMTGTALAADRVFQDVAADSPYAAAVEALAQKGVVQGAGNGVFAPDTALNPAQLAAFLARIAGAAVNQSVVNTGIADDGWSGAYLSWAVDNGIITLSDTVGQYTSLDAGQVNGILSAFAAYLGIEAPTVTAAGAAVTRGEAVQALAQLAGQSFHHAAGTGYQTVTSAQDWGPAISKVILSLGTDVDPASVTADKFQVLSDRIYDETSHVAARTVTSAYVSDAQGNQAESGSYVTLELKIGPDETAGSPFNYEFATSGHNVYVITLYYISLTQPLTAADGLPLSMDRTSRIGDGGTVTPLADQFQLDSYTAEDGITLKYAWWTPEETAADGSTPLIIWLHGAGEGGENPYVALIGNKVVNLITDGIQQYFGAAGAQVLVPQTPTIWLDKDGTNTYMGPEDTGRSYYTDALMGLIETYVAAHPEVDADRIYIGGCSNGGYMTVNMLMEFPGYFAAAYPVCEAYDVAWITDAKIDAIKDTPIWITAAKTDGTVPLFQGETDPANFSVYHLTLDENGDPIPLDNYSNALYDRLVAAGAADVHYSLFDKVEDTTGLYFQADGVTPYEYMGHWSWLYILNNQCVDTIGGREVTLFDWLSQQSK